jgi:hypothetical protein
MSMQDQIPGWPAPEGAERDTDGTILRGPSLICGCPLDCGCDGCHPGREAQAG